MVKPVNYDTTGALAEGWKGAAMGAVGGVVGLGAVGGALSALVVGGIAAVAGSALALPLAGIAFAVGGIATAAALFTPGLIGGSLLGLMHGGSKVSAAKAAYQARAEHRAFAQETKMNDVAMQGMQQGYQAGFAEGQQYVVAQLQQAHQQMVMGNAGLSNQPGAAAAKIDASRAAGMGSPAVA